MITRHSLRFFAALFFVGILSEIPLPGDDRAPSAPAFWTPKDPPGAEYRLEARIAVEAGVVGVSGGGTVTLTNTASRPLAVLAFDWTVSHAQTLELTVDGRPLRRLNEGLGLPPATPIFYELPAPLGPGKKARIDMVFSFKAATNDGQISLRTGTPACGGRGCRSAIPLRSSWISRRDTPWPSAAASIRGRAITKTIA